MTNQELMKGLRLLLNDVDSGAKTIDEAAGLAVRVVALHVLSNEVALNRAQREGESPVHGLSTRQQFQ